MQFGLLPAKPVVLEATIGGMEMIIILVVVLILFGGSRLPQLGESLGKSIRNFKKGFSGEEPREIDVTPKKQMAGPVEAKVLGASDPTSAERQLAEAEARKVEMEAEIAALKERAAGKKV